MSVSVISVEIISVILGIPLITILLIISSDSKVGPREILQSGKGGLLFKVGKIDKLYYLLRNLDINSKKIKKKINTSFNYVIKNYQKDISISFIKLIKNIS